MPSLLNGVSPLPAAADSVTPADAYTANKNAIGSLLADQRAKSVAMGLLDPDTGLPTKAGLINAAQQYAGAMVAGTAAPGGPGVSLDSPAFAKWFGASKVVDDAGKPLVVYHQTSADRLPDIYDKGFSTDPAVARARLSDEQVPNGIFFKPNEKDIGVGSADANQIAQVPAHLSLQNPLVVNDRDALQVFMVNTSPEYAQNAVEMKRIDAAYNKQFEEIWNSEAFARRHGSEVAQAKMDNLLSQWGDATKAKAADMRGIVDAVLQQNGYDGVVINNDVGSLNRSTKTYIALNPTQVKSPDNRGTFSSSDPRIMYGAAGLAGGSAAAMAAKERVDATQDAK